MSEKGERKVDGKWGKRNRTSKQCNIKGMKRRHDKRKRNERKEKEKERTEQNTSRTEQISESAQLFENLSRKKKPKDLR